MTQDFNLKRARLLTKSIFLINKKKIIWGVIICFGIMLICSIIDISISNGTKYNLLSPLSFRIIITGTLILVTYSIFPIYQNRLYVHTSHMLPASTNEKFFVPFIISLIFFPIIIYTLYIIAISLSWVLSHIINSDTAEYAAIIFNKETFFTKSPISYFAGLAWYHSFLLLALNTKNAKFIIFGVVTLIGSIIMDYTFYDRQIPQENSEIIKYSMDYILAILFWIVSYINFKKIETTK